MFSAYGLGFVDTDTDDGDGARVVSATLSRMRAARSAGISVGAITTRGGTIIISGADLFSAARNDADLAAFL